MHTSVCTAMLLGVTLCALPVARSSATERLLGLWLIPLICALSGQVAVTFTFVVHRNAAHLLEGEVLEPDSFGQQHTASALVHYFPLVFALLLRRLVTRGAPQAQTESEHARWSRVAVVAAAAMLPLMLYSLTFQPTDIYGGTHATRWQGAAAAFCATVAVSSVAA